LLQTDVRAEASLPLFVVMRSSTGSIHYVRTSSIKAINLRIGDRIALHPFGGGDDSQSNRDMLCIPDDLSGRPNLPGFVYMDPALGSTDVLWINKQKIDSLFSSPGCPDNLTLVFGNLYVPVEDTPANRATLGLPPAR
jgi:hypothetical protein